MLLHARFALPIEHDQPRATICHTVLPIKDATTSCGDGRRSLSQSQIYGEPLYGLFAPSFHTTLLYRFWLRMH